MSAISSSSQRASKDPLTLVQKIHRRLVLDSELSFSRHTEACEHLVLLRQSIQDDGALPKKAREHMLCTGISVWRRAFLSSDVQTELLQRTCTLAFVVLCMSEAASTLNSASSSTTQTAQLLTSAGKTSVWSLLQPMVEIATSKTITNELEARAANPEIPEDTLIRLVEPSTDGAPEDNSDLNEEAEAEEDDDDRVSKRRRVTWREVIDDAKVPRMGDLARMTMQKAVAFMRTDAVVSTLDEMGADYFRYTSLHICETMLMPRGEEDVVTLSSAPSLRLTQEQREEKLAVIVSNAESEAGQMLSRDLLMSMWLPANVVKTRRTLVLSRQASTFAGAEYPEITQRAHEVAMQGAEWCWQNSNHECERMGMLLAGLAIMTTRTSGDDPDAIRKKDAFGGRVQLPFLETAPPLAGMRLVLIPHAKRWILYRLTSHGTPSVVLSQRGFEGFCSCVIQLVASLSR